MRALRRILLRQSLITAGILAALSPSSMAATGPEIETFTGARTRVVWKHDMSGRIGGDNAADSRDAAWEIRGIDSRENQVRTIVPGNISCVWPKLTHDGSKVLYCGDYQLNGNQNKVIAVNWDGTGRTVLGDGGSIALWYDKATATEWVYVGNNYGTFCGGTCRSGNRLERFPVSNPTNRQLVWQGSGTNNQFSFWFSVSGDGRYIGGGFANGSETTPSILDPATGKIYVTKQGCYGSISPDTAHRFFRYDTPHGSVKIWDFDLARYQYPSTPEWNGWGNERDVSVHNNNGSTWGISWTNNGGFLTLHNAYTDMNVYLLKWNADYTAIASNLRVTTDAAGMNCMATAWIDPGQSTVTAPLMRLSTSLIDLNIAADAASVPVQTVTVSNAGTGTLNDIAASVTYSQGANWVSIARSGSGNSQSFANSVAVAGLPAGISAATVTLTCPNAVPSTTTYQIRITKAAALRKPDVPLRTLETGLSYDYFRGTYTTVGDLTGKPPVKSGTVGTFSLAPADTTANYGFVFTGYIDIAQSGAWTFTLAADDGAVLRIGDSVVVNNDGSHTLAAKTGTIGLEKGLHRITVSYIQRVTVDSLRVDYQGPSVSSATTVPASVLRHEPSSKPLTLLEPLGGRTYRFGDTLTIRWTSDSVVTQSVYLEISVDGGLSYFPISSAAIRKGDPEWGNYRYVIPNTLTGAGGTVPAASAECVIKVQDYNNAATVDVSPAYFTIAPNSAASMTRPRGKSDPRIVVHGGRVTVSVPEAGGNCRVFVLDARGDVVWRSAAGRGIVHWDGAAMGSGRVRPGAYWVIVAGSAGQRTAKSIIVAQ